MSERNRLIEKVLELQRENNDLKSEKAELIEFVGHLYVNYHLPYGTMDIDTKKRFEEIRLKYLATIEVK